MITKKIYKGIINPGKAIEHIERKLGRQYLFIRYEDPTNPFYEDWDNLIILDACRFDIFSEQHTFSGELDYRLSPASGTMEWLKKTVEGNNFNDTVYITANPRVSRYNESFHKVVPAWKTHWDDELNVTPPQDVTDLTQKVANEYPHKRIVSHYMQPHIPFIGDFGRHKIGVYDGVTKGRNRALGNEYSPNEEPYVLLEQGKIETDTAKKAYRENLRLTLSAIKPLLSELDGKTVVTSDHGELLGENGWGHYIGGKEDKLLEVPWLEVSNGEQNE